MIAMLQLFFGPLILTGLTLWAAWLAFAAEADAELPRSLAGPANGDAIAVSRQLHVAHLACLVLAGAAAGTTVVWWAWAPLPGLARLVLAVGVVWVAWADARMRPSSHSAAQRHMGSAQRDMLLGVFSLADTTVTEIMTPRIDIVAVDLSATRDDVVRTLKSSEHARLLVYDGNPDAIVGVIYAKDMLAHLNDADTPWHAFIRPGAFVPEAKTLDRQLRDFQRGPSHIAIVVDEFGGTAGLVTLEDILEEIVGEIRDEYDIDEVAQIQELGDDEWRVQGGTALTELEAALGHRFERQDVSTVGGLVLAEFGRVPRTGEMLELDGFQLIVEQIVRRRVRRVTVRRVPVPASSPGPEEE